jgi:hypothetical protein
VAVYETVNRIRTSLSFPALIEGQTLPRSLVEHALSAFKYKPGDLPAPKPVTRRPSRLSVGATSDSDDAAQQPAR